MKNTKNRKKKSVIQRRNISAMLLLCFLLFAAAFWFFRGRASVVEANPNLSEVQYKIVEIQYGESLWSIAEDNMNPGYDDVYEYIDAIRECNQLEDDELTAGNYLMIPCYHTRNASVSSAN